MTTSILPWQILHEVQQKSHSKTIGYNIILLYFPLIIIQCRGNFLFMMYFIIFRQINYNKARELSYACATVLHHRCPLWLFKRRQAAALAFSIFANVHFSELKGNHLGIKLQDLRERTLQLYHVI